MVGKFKVWFVVFSLYIVSDILFLSFQKKHILMPFVFTLNLLFIYFEFILDPIKQMNSIVMKITLEDVQLIYIYLLCK